MGYVWEENPVFLTHGGVTIYHVFKDDDADNGNLRAYYYALTGYGTDSGGGDDNGEFDVRTLSEYKGSTGWEGDADACKLAITKAIDSGEIEPWEE